MSKRRYFERRSDEDLVYIEFETDQGRVVSFSVQYAARIDGRWRDVKRTDTAHGRLHVHRFWLPRDRQVEDLEPARATRDPYDVALRDAILDIKNHWLHYRSQLAAALALDPWLVQPDAGSDPGGEAD